MREVGQVGFFKHQHFLFCVAADRGQKFFRPLGALFIGEARPRDMRFNVLGHDLIKQTIHCSTNSGDPMKNGSAVSVVAERTLDGRNLATDPPHAGNQ